jgi:hypothetical protein
MSPFWAAPPWCLTEGKTFLLGCHISLPNRPSWTWCKCLDLQRPKLFFIVENGQGNYLLIFLHCLGGGGAPWFFILFFFTIEGEGRWRLIFFSPSFEMWKEEGKGVNFSLKIFFHCGVAEEGKVFFFLTNSLWGEGLVESDYFQSTRPSWVWIH